MAKPTACGGGCELALYDSAQYFLGKNSNYLRAGTGNLFVFRQTANYL